MIREKSCGAVIFIRQENHAKYLLLNYAARHWDFPKGNVEPNETEKETALREIKEETGISDAHFIDGFKETIAYFYRRQGLTVHKEVVFFVMESHTEKITLSFEHIGYVWMDYAQALEKLNFKNAKNVLQKANDFLQKKGIVKD